MSGRENAIEYLNYYLDQNSEPDFAVLLEGPWGLGATEQGESTPLRWPSRVFSPWRKAGETPWKKYLNKAGHLASDPYNPDSFHESATGLAKCAQEPIQSRLDS